MTSLPRENPFLLAVLALYLLAWFLVLLGNGWAVALAGSAAYVAGQAWCMRSGKFHLSADGVALPLAAVAVVGAALVQSAVLGQPQVRGLVTAVVGLGMAWLAGHGLVALATALAAPAERLVRRLRGRD